MTRRSYQYGARVLVGGCAATLWWGLLIAGQTPASATPQFAAASVKRNTSGSDNGGRNLGAGGRLVFDNYQLHRLVSDAYEVEEFQVLGGPAWARSDGYDIVATAGSPAPLTQLNLMLRGLLAERFKLVVSLEQREMSSYVLSRVRAEGPPGPSLKRATADCGPTGRGSGPGPTAGCAAWLGPGSIAFSGQPMSQLARALGMMLRQPVVDKTGLGGGFDFELKFNPDLPGIPSGPPGAPGPPVDPNRPTMFVALREQLGLRLESQRAQTPVVVIKSAERPAEN